MKWYVISAISIGFFMILLLLAAGFYRSFFKRFFDILLSGLAIVVFSPFLFMLALCGAIAMGGNPFFVQPRPGMIDPKTGQEKIFNMVKFRTMSNKKDKQGNLLPDELRLNTYGKLLRSTSLDELPELFCIFTGSMSIVGPRPQLVRDLVFMTDEQRRRHTVKPGLTGLAQVKGRNNISWEDKFRYDLEYIDNRVSLWHDIWILLLTVYKVVKRSDTVREGTESDIDFGDWLLAENKVNAEEYSEKQSKAEELLKV